MFSYFHWVRCTVPFSETSDAQAEVNSESVHLKIPLPFSRGEKI